jgi:hypothetical protein
VKLLTHILCPECGEGSLRPIAVELFCCQECSAKAGPDDLELPKGRTWAITDGGFVGHARPADEVLAEMEDRLDDYMAAPHDSLGELEALRAYRDLFFELDGILRRGADLPTAWTLASTPAGRAR